MLERLTSLRKKKKWSLQQTADFLDIPKSTYAGYESGYRRPSLEALKSMADLFETTTDYILGRVKEEATQKEETTISLNHIEHSQLTVDEQQISEEELTLFIALVRAKRTLDVEE